MCTVTVVSHDGGFRLMCNRDEQRNRAPALVPAMHRLVRRTAVYPIDPVGGGTWVGVNDRGLVAALLNRNPRNGLERTNRPLASRGLIVAAVLDTESVDAAAATLASVDPGAFDLFQLLVAHGSSGRVFVSDGRRIAPRPCNLTRPFILTSSSLGDHVVAAPRITLFNRLMRAWPGAPLTAQELFHDHQWTQQREISVRMERADARTVSRTLIDVAAGAVRVAYEPLEGRHSVEAA